MTFDEGTRLGRYEIRSQLVEQEKRDGLGTTKTKARFSGGFWGARGSNRRSGLRAAEL
jgi:hypothetical protein